MRAPRAPISSQFDRLAPSIDLQLSILCRSGVSPALLFFSRRRIPQAAGKIGKPPAAQLQRPRVTCFLSAAGRCFAAQGTGKPAAASIISLIGIKITEVASVHNLLTALIRQTLFWRHAWPLRPHLSRRTARAVARI